VWLIGWATVTAYSGDLELQGLDARVEIIRDSEGVPHVIGASLNDIHTALGAVHAQDRLWQMELLRRAGQGRLSEIFGEQTLRTDIFMRTLDLAGAAERAFARLPDTSRAALEAYARGVNAWLERPTRRIQPRLPPEFLLLRHRPEPWRPADSVTLLKVMALSLSTNFQHEITRLLYAAQGMTPAEIEDLMPPDEGGPPLPDIRNLYPLRTTPQRQASAGTMLLDDPGTGASNNWVVSGARTRSGAPMLANDPHLRLSAPSTWYFAHVALTQPGKQTVNAVGATLPGVPLVVLGRSDMIAWGFTNTGADVQDLFIEKINADNPDEYLTPDGWRPFVIEPMDFRLKDGSTVRLERRRTRHGPVIPSFYRGIGAALGDGHVAALQWTALADDDTTIAAGLLDPTVRTVEDYVRRMRDYIVPMQSMVVADKGGSIGMIAPGRIPVRDAANPVAGRAPVPGWDARYDWKGFVPFDRLPRVVNPAAGAIATANARILPSDYPYLVTLDWDANYRRQRLQEIVVEHAGHDMASMRAAQLDVLSLAAVQLKGMMIAAARAAGHADTATLEQLQAWNGEMRAERAEPLIFMAWMRETASAIWSDDLGPLFQRAINPNAPALTRLLVGQSRGRDWCDDRATTRKETCGEFISRALTRALADLGRRYGANSTRWTWGAAHFAFGEHRPFGMITILGSFFNVTVPSPGGPYTVNRGQVELGTEPVYANRHAASCRAIYDFSNLDDSLFIHTTGQSGNPFSPLYRSFAERWSRGEYIRLPTARDRIEPGALGTWRLIPR
jgi:penicillin amidase